jgi:hypothetical protein
MITLGQYNKFGPGADGQKDRHANASKDPNK